MKSGRRTRVLPLGLILTLSALAAPVGAGPAPTSAAVPGLPTVESGLGRALFDAAIARGPQRIVASVEVRPALERGRFLGFQIVRFTPDGDLRDCTSLLPGDVVLSVNRESLERPEQFMRAWDVVKAATALEIEVMRGGQRLLYRWKLEP